MRWFLELFGGQLAVFWGLLNEGLGGAWTQAAEMGKLANKANSLCQRIICSPKYPQSSSAFHF